MFVLSFRSGDVFSYYSHPVAQEQHQNVLSCIPGDNGILTAAEACMSVTLTHMNAVAHQWVQAADYVECHG